MNLSLTVFSSQQLRTKPKDKVKTTLNATLKSKAALYITSVLVQVYTMGKEAALCGATFIQDIYKYMVAVMELCVDGGYGEI